MVYFPPWPPNVLLTSHFPWVMFCEGERPELGPEDPFSWGLRSQFSQFQSHFYKKQYIPLLPRHRAAVLGCVTPHLVEMAPTDSVSF